MPDDEELSLLRKMQHTLDDIKAILILTYQDRLEETKNRLLKQGSVKEKIYELCDGTRTVSDIAAVIQKSTDYINSYLSILRREGLIRTVEKDGIQFHEQMF
jgi:Mn-dependent DtxR family transcriptional regulator